MNVEAIKRELNRRLTETEEQLIKAEEGSVRRGVLQVEMNTLRNFFGWILTTEGTMDDLMEDAKIRQDFSQIRQNIVEGINRFVLLHERKGHFITAVLSNDMREAFARADEENIRTMFQIVSYCHNEIPGVCWGSPEKVKAWLDVPREKWVNVEAPESTKEVERQKSLGIWSGRSFEKAGGE